MIHYITCHFGTDILFKMQREHIEYFTTSEYKIWASYTPTPGNEKNDTAILEKNKKYYHHFEYIPTTITNDAVQLQYYKLKSNLYTKKGRYNGSRNHQNNLHILTERVLTDKDTKDDDIIIWLDADSFIINNVNNYFDKQSEKFIAVQRREFKTRNGSPLLAPHPCFAACSVKFWKENKLNWHGCTVQQRRKRADAFPDTGGYLYIYFNDKKIEWKKMLFTDKLPTSCNSIDARISFTVYDDMVMHVCGVSMSYVPCRQVNLNKKINRNKNTLEYILSGEYLADLKKNR